MRSKVTGAKPKPRLPEDPLYTLILQQKNPENHGVGGSNCWVKQQRFLLHCLLLPHQAEDHC